MCELLTYVIEKFSVTKYIKCYYDCDSLKSFFSSTPDDYQQLMKSPKYITSSAYARQAIALFAPKKCIQKKLTLKKGLK